MLILVSYCIFLVLCLFSMLVVVIEVPVFFMLIADAAFPFLTRQLLPYEAAILPYLGLDCDSFRDSAFLQRAKRST